MKRNVLLTMAVAAILLFAPAISFNVSSPISSGDDKQSLVIDLDFQDQAVARSRGGGSKSYGGSKSRSSSSRKAAPSKSSQKKKSYGSDKKTSGSTNKATTKTKAQKQRAYEQSKSKYDKAKTSGKAFDNKAAASKDFKTKNAGKYQSNYATKPATRPEHIPQTTKGPNGNTHTVVYNQGGGGYGYMNAMGTFMMYDMMSDALMMNRMMDRQGYYVGSAPVQPVYVRNSGSSVLAVLGGIVVFAVVIVVIVALVRKA